MNIRENAKYFYFGLWVGEFLRNTGRLQKAIEIYKECLVLLNSKVERMGKLHLDIYMALSGACQMVGDSRQAIGYHEKALAISIEIGHREGEGECYGNLGTAYQSLGDYENAIEFYKKALAISIEVGSREKGGRHYGNLGTVYQSLGDYVKANEFIEKALAISIEIGDRTLEGRQYGNLGAIYLDRGNYKKAKTLVEKALAISIDKGDRKGEEEHYRNLGTAYENLGDKEKAKELYYKALAISKEIGDRTLEGEQYGKLGTMYLNQGDYAKAKEFLQKGLAISREIGDRQGEARRYGELGLMYRSFGDYVTAKEFLEKALAISIEIGNRGEEGTFYGSLGTLNLLLGYNEIAEECYKKRLSIDTELERVEEEATGHCRLAKLHVSMKKYKEARSSLFSAVERCESLRRFLGNNDQYKIYFADEKKFPYSLLASMLCELKEINKALFVAELGRARALADLMSAQYSVNGLERANQLTLIDIDEIMHIETSTCTVLYISFFLERMAFWIIKINSKISFKEENVNNTLIAMALLEMLVDQIYLTISLGEEYEDRSLFTFYERVAQHRAQAEDKHASCRLVKEKEQKQKQALRSLYKVIISPVADQLEGSEIIICPELSLYQVPFAALMDEDERYLSEKFRIRLIPSLTTLKLTQDCPADYHSQTGVLIVGDPDAGPIKLSRLPAAKEEAKMIGRLLHVQPLIGCEATKQAVLQSMRSVSLIHIAAHGDAKRGEIALAPLRPTRRTPQKEDFVLTMSDVSEVQLRAKLVVLSCCHSGRGEIRAEGAIGIARAFLGSGARSVLVSLWAVDDTATKEFMREFYEHLSRGESASECLHEAMKWMRGRPEYCAVRKWAPFVLIGDNVVFNFKGLTRDQRSNSK